MENKDEIKTKILKLFDEADKTKANSISIKDNIIGDNNTQIKTDKLIVTQKVVTKKEIQRDSSWVTSKQAFEIRNILYEIVEADYNSKKYKPKEKPYKTWYNKLYHKFKVTSYKEIIQEQFDSVIKWLKQQLAIFTGTYTYSKNNNDNYRKKLYSAIHALINELEWSNDKYREYLYNNYGVLSSKELDDKKLKNFKGRLQSQAQYRRNKN